MPCLPANFSGNPSIDTLLSILILEGLSQTMKLSSANTETAVQTESRTYFTVFISTVCQASS
jgi:hypothetical protein